MKRSKCKVCGTYEDVNFEGMCEKCYKESIEASVQESTKDDEQDKNILDILTLKWNEFSDRISNLFKPPKLKETIKTLIIIFLAVILSGCIASSSDYNEYYSRNQELLSQTEDLKSQINDLNSKLEEDNKKIEENNKQISDLKNEKETLETKNNELNQEIEQLKASQTNTVNTSTSSTPTSSSNSNYNASSNKKSSSTSSTSSSTTNSYTVYVTKTGSKYHSSGCSYLKNSKIAIDKNSAIYQGYTPCSRCNP